MHGVFLDAKSLDRNDLDWQALRACLDNWQLYDSTRPDQLRERLQDADVVVVNKVVLDRETLQSAKRLRLIAVAATGTNNVDIAAAQALGITVCNARNYATPSVVQHVFSVMLILTTQLLRYRQAVRDGDWQRSDQFCLLDYPITELAGKNLGVIGYGVTGQAVAAVARAFGMNVMAAARKGRSVVPGRMPFEAVLQQADVLTLHCPLTPETQNLIGAKELASMKPGALLINAARGGIVDEKALVQALQQNTIAGAAVDTLSQEPPTDDNPLLAVQLPNLIVTPHIAWASRESRQRLLGEVVQNIQAFRLGEVRNKVTAGG